MKRRRGSSDLETVRALRLDLAFQIGRHVKSLGRSQVDVARSLRIPQPTQA